MAYNKDFKPLQREGCDKCKLTRKQEKRACPLVAKEKRWRLVKKQLIWSGTCPIMGAVEAMTCMGLMFSAKDSILPRCGGLAEQPSAFYHAWEIFRPASNVAENELMDRVENNG